jgi:hypothetical protein
MIDARASGCRFTPRRCTLATDRCRQEVPALHKTESGALVACWHADLRLLRIGYRLLCAQRGHGGKSAARLELLSAQIDGFKPAAMGAAMMVFLRKVMARLERHRTSSSQTLVSRRRPVFCPAGRLDRSGSQVPTHFDLRRHPEGIASPVHHHKEGPVSRIPLCLSSDYVFVNERCVTSCRPCQACRRQPNPSSAIRQSWLPW